MKKVALLHGRLLLGALATGALGAALSLSPGARAQAAPAGTVAPGATAAASVAPAATSVSAAAAAAPSVTPPATPADAGDKGTATQGLAGLPSPLTAAAVLKYAVDHRAEIVAAKAKVAAAAEVPKQVKALPEPMVMAAIDHLPISLEGVNASFQIQQDFPLSGVLGAKERAAEADVKVRAAGVETARLDVEYQALAAFLMVIEVERMIVVMDDQVAIAKQMVAVSQARLASTAAGGMGAPGLDVMRMQLDVARMEGERKALDAERKSAAAMLEAALGRPVSGEVPACELTLPGADPPALSELVKKAVDKRPELAAMKASVSKASADVDVMTSMYAPMAFVRVGGAYTMMEGPGVMLMVGVNVPIWREKLGAGVAEAKAMTTMAEADVSAMRTMLEGEVGAARQAVVGARTRLATVRDKVLPLSRSVLSLSIATYVTGQLPLVSVLEAAKAVRDARQEEVIAEVKAAAAWARLGRSVGEVKLGI